MVLRALLQNGGNAETEDREGESPLHKACKDCNFHIVRELLQFIRGFTGHTQVNKCYRVSRKTVPTLTLSCQE